MPFDLNQSDDKLIAEFKERLSTNRSWVEKAIVTIYQYQTMTEKEDKETSENNGVGFSGPDARKLSKAAEWLLKDSRNHLNDYYLELAFARMPKYSKQLLKIARSKQPKN